MVETNAVPRKRPATAGRTVEGQAVVTDADTAQVVILNDVGTRVWNLIDGRRTVEQIVSAVRGQLAEEGYDAVPAGVAGDVDEFLVDLESRGMISLEAEG